jgi:hypothetical protein
VSSSFASGKIANGICDRCGFQYKLNTLKRIVKNRSTVNILVCSQCWEPDHPQNHLGELPVYDPQALRNPRSDTSGFGESRAQIIMFKAFTMTIITQGAPWIE